jgi:hypothetical protein
MDNALHVVGFGVFKPFLAASEDSLAASQPHIPSGAFLCPDLVSFRRLKAIIGPLPPTTTK